MSGVALAPAGTRNQQIGIIKYRLGISTNQSRKLLTFLLDTSARQKVNFSNGQRSTSLRSILSRDFPRYVILPRIVPGPKPSSGTQLLRKTGVTMVTSSFGLYHGLWLDDAPTKQIGIIPTPWTMTRVLGFIEILQVHE